MTLIKKKTWPKYFKLVKSEYCKKPPWGGFLLKNMV